MYNIEYLKTVSLSDKLCFCDEKFNHVFVCLIKKYFDPPPPPTQY